MKELDFDELDKAVNSLMTGASSDSPSKSEPEERVVDVTSRPDEAKNVSNPSSPVSASTVASQPSSMPTPVVVSSPAVPARSTSSVQATPASRRGGRFMDVVHPSSNMKKETATRPVSREGAALQPRETASFEEPSSPVASSITSDEKVSSPVDSSASKSDWPDPLEMANFSDKEDTKATNSVDVSAKPKEAPSSTPLDEDMDDPLVSPFLPDTKVEKRPLGANAASSDDAASLPVLVDTDDQLPATAEDTRPLLPEELHSDLVAIESDTTEPEKTEPLEEKKSETKEPEAPKSSVWEKVKNTPEEPAEKEKDIPKGPGSIPQQYREEQSTASQESGAIYDTDSYHQPLAHPAKQKSGWMWVVWILLILVVGGGSGAAIYFLGLIR